MHNWKKKQYTTNQRKMPSNATVLIEMLCAKNEIPFDCINSMGKQLLVINRWYNWALIETQSADVVWEAISGDIRSLLPQNHRSIYWCCCVGRARALTHGPIKWLFIAGRLWKICGLEHEECAQMKCIKWHSHWIPIANENIQSANGI